MIISPVAFNNTCSLSSATLPTIPRENIEKIQNIEEQCLSQRGISPRKIPTPSASFRPKRNPRFTPSYCKRDFLESMNLVSYFQNKGEGMLPSIPKVERPLKLNISSSNPLKKRKASEFTESHREEQLRDYFSLLNFKFKDSPDLVHEAYEWGIKLQKEKITSGEELLGMLIYLVNETPESIPNLVTKRKEKDSWKNIQSAFEREIGKLKEKIDIHYQNHAKTKLQSSEIAKKTALPHLLSQILINDMGMINIGIIPHILKEFLTDQEFPLNHEISLLTSLQELFKTAKLRSRFYTPLPECSFETPAYKMVQVVLGIPEGTPIKEVDLRRFALSALLSHLRQRATSSCFATSLAIELLSSHLGKCLEDFFVILTASKLSRSFKGLSKDYPFLLPIDYSHLETSIELFSNGRVAEGFLWEAPGIQKACQAVGIADCKAAILSLKDKLFKSEQSSQTIIVKNILEWLSEYASASRSMQTKEASRLFPLACLAYESQVEHLLLRAWESAIAGMTEGLKGGRINRAIVQSIIKIFLRKCHSGPFKKGKKVNSTILAIVRNIEKRMRFPFDISFTEKKGEIYQTTGAFVLYDTGDSSNHEEWVRIDNPEAFRAFISRVIKKIANEEGEKRTPQISRKIIKYLCDFCLTDCFLLEMLCSYHPQNMMEDDPLVNYKNLLFTPWVTKKCGSDANELLKVYLENHEGWETEIVQSTDSKEFLLKIISLARTLPEKAKESYLLNPYRLDPVRTPGIHAFSLMLGHSTLLEGWNSEIDPKEWIEKRLIKPGMEVATSLIELTFAERVVEKIRSANLVKKIRNWEDLLTFCKKPLTIKEFRQQLVEFIDKHEPIAEKLLPIRKYQIDRILYKHLPLELKKMLNRSAVHFADTNGASGINDLHFCFVVNPGSGILEIWKAYDNSDDSAKMYALDQRDWSVLEFYKRPDLIFEKIARESEC